MGLNGNLGNTDVKGAGDPESEGEKKLGPGAKGDKWKYS